MVDLSKVTLEPCMDQRDLGAQDYYKRTKGKNDSAIINNASEAELLEILEMTETWSSKGEGKFSLYEPAPVLWYAHASPAKTRVILGGNRSSKTYSMLMEFCAQFLGKAPKSIADIMPKHRLDPHRRIRLCTVDYPNNFSKVIWPYIQQFIPSDSIVDVLKDSGRVRAITNRYGGFIEFMMYESEVSKYQGASRHCVGYDEQPPQEIRDENLMRLVDTNGEEFFALTPIQEANYGQTAPWINDELYSKASYIVEKRDGEIFEVNNSDGDPEIHVFFANIYDNPAINADAATRILSRFSNEEREVRTTGHLLFLSGLVYKEYTEKVHLIDAFDDWWKGDNKNDYTLYIAIDPHPRTPHNVLFLCARRDGILFIVDEIFSSADSAIDLVNMIKTHQRGKVANLIIIDPLAYTRDPRDGSCFAFDLAEAELYPIPLVASKDKARGILRVRETLKDTSGNARIFINRECKNFRYEITHYVWDSYKKSISDSKGMKQKPVDKADHAMENLYRLLLLDPQHVEFQMRDIADRVRKQQCLGRSASTGY